MGRRSANGIQRARQRDVPRSRAIIHNEVNRVQRARQREYTRKHGQESNTGRQTKDTGKRFVSRLANNTRQSVRER